MTAKVKKSGVVTTPPVVFLRLSMFLESFKSIASVFFDLRYPDRGYRKRMLIFRYFQYKITKLQKTGCLLLNCSYAYENWSNARS